MDARFKPDTGARIIERAKAFGASLAGIAGVASLLDSPSYGAHARPELSQQGESLLVLALAHERTKPELDWWDHRKGSSPGDRRLESIGHKLKQILKEEFNITARLFPYAVQKGGIFLKDAAVLAGLGIIGRNNLLITRKFGPRVRLRALLLGAHLEPAGPIDFFPCHACNLPCMEACPQNAFKNHSYSRTRCYVQMREDERNRVIHTESLNHDSPKMHIKYCRACEMACPVPE